MGNFRDLVSHFIWVLSFLISPVGGWVFVCLISVWSGCHLSAGKERDRMGDVDEHVECESAIGNNQDLDDDGRPKRTGTYIYDMVLFGEVRSLVLTMFFGALCRYSLDGKFTHNNSGDRVRGDDSALGCGSAWKGCSSLLSPTTCLHHFLYFQSLSRLLQVSNHRQQELHLHGCCQKQFRFRFLSLSRPPLNYIMWLIDDHFGN